MATQLQSIEPNARPGHSGRIVNAAQYQGWTPDAHHSSQPCHTRINPNNELHGIITEQQDLAPHDPVIQCIVTQRQPPGPTGHCPRCRASCSPLIARFVCNLGLPQAFRQAWHPWYISNWLTCPQISLRHSTSHPSTLNKIGRQTIVTYDSVKTVLHSSWPITFGQS